MSSLVPDSRPALSVAVPVGRQTTIVAMASWEDGPEYAPLVRPDAFTEPTTSPLSVAPAHLQPAASAPKQRPAFDDPSEPVAPLSSLVPPVEDPRDPALPFEVVTTTLTSADSAWGAAHWAPPTGPPATPWASPVATPSPSPWPAPTEPLVPQVGPASAANGFPAPGTAAWFTPPAPPQPTPSTTVTAKDVLDAVTPGVYISLAIGGLVYVLSPIMLLMAFALSSRMQVARPSTRRNFITAFGVLGFLALAGMLNSPSSFGEWWSFVGAWGLLLCWLVLLATSLVVYRDLRRRANEQTAPPSPWG
jgi:hypothetical protein